MAANTTDELARQVDEIYKAHSVEATKHRHSHPLYQGLIRQLLEKVVSVVFPQMEVILLQIIDPQDRVEESKD
jgi:hypothetical protein